MTKPLPNYSLLKSNFNALTLVKYTTNILMRIDKRNKSNATPERFTMGAGLSDYYLYAALKGMKGTP